MSQKMKKKDITKNVITVSLYCFALILNVKRAFLKQGDTTSEQKQI